MLLAAMLSILIGVSLGLLGGGGSILSVPVLVYAVGLDAKEAIATSLLVVGVTSLVAMVPHARAGNVQWRTGALFSAASMTGAFLGGRLAAYISGTVLLLMFAGMMVATGVAMLRGRKGPEVVQTRPISIPLVLVEGLVVGLVTGLVGAGGGFLVVPALVLLGGLPMRTAVGTSLMVIAMKSFAGFAGHISHVTVDYHLAAVVTGAAVLGAVGGALFSEKVPAASLRRGFAVFVLVMAVFLVYKQAGPMLHPAAVAAQ